ncbi:Beta-glucoside kinase [compost metagenome]
MNADPKCVDGKTIFDKIRKGDKALERIVDQWADEVSLGLASFIHVFNPEAIIVGGGVMEQQALVQLIEAKSKALVMDSFRDVVILRAALGNKAGVLGAASMFLS